MSFIDQISFDVDVRDLYDVHGKRIDPDLGREVFRIDTNEAISICGPSFKPVQHREIVEPFMMKLEQEGYDIEERDHDDRNSLYDLKGKKGAFVKSTLDDGGAVMRTDFILRDFIDVTSSTGSFGLAKGEDTSLLRFSIINSHNSKLAARINSDLERIICLNGQTRSDFSASAYGKHTMNLNLDAMLKKADIAREGLLHDQERFIKWASTPIDTKMAELMLQKTIAKLADKANGDERFSKTKVETILRNFQNEGGRTAFDLFNGVTEWATHADYREGANTVTAPIVRERAVAGMLRSKEWKTLVAA